MSEQYHVLSVTPRQQAALRLMLYNLFCMFVRKSMEDLQNYMHSETALDKIESKYRLIIEKFEQYDNFTSVFCSREQANRSEMRMVTLEPEAMRVIQLAIKNFDKDRCFIEKGEIQYILSEYPKLTKLVTESAQFTYTQDEIRKGGK